MESGIKQWSDELFRERPKDFVDRASDLDMLPRWSILKEFSTPFPASRKVLEPRSELAAARRSEAHSASARGH